ncbi:MAG TPA: hypothetical protein VMZ92_08655 [Planctomycetota bacterium]|nr:hypothetical protein [Planctomycetota bacterium]
MAKSGGKGSPARHMAAVKSWVTRRANMGGKAGRPSQKTLLKAAAASGAIVRRNSLARGARSVTISRKGMSKTDVKLERGYAGSRPRRIGLVNAKRIARGRGALVFKNQGFKPKRKSYYLSMGAVKPGAGKHMAALKKFSMKKPKASATPKPKIKRAPKLPPGPIAAHWKKGWDRATGRVDRAEAKDRARAARGDYLKKYRQPRKNASPQTIANWVTSGHTRGD